MTNRQWHRFVLDIRAVEYDSALSEDLIHRHLDDHLPEFAGCVVSHPLVMVTSESDMAAAGTLEVRTGLAPHSVGVPSSRQPTLEVML